MAKTEILTCEVCGFPWERERKNGTRPKYCSPKCKQRHRNPEKWKKLTCTVCGAGWNWKVRGGATPKSCSEKCRKQYYADKSQAWRDRNPERYLEHAQNTRKKNREVINSRNRKNRALYPELFRQYDLTKRRRHPEAIRLRQKRYRAENRDSLMRKNREWREKNKGRIQANNIRRKAVIRGDFVEDVFKDVLLDRDGWTCHICKGEIPKGLDRVHPLFPHIEHIVPLSKGGEHSYGNTAPPMHLATSKRGACWTAGRTSSRSSRRKCPMSRKKSKNRVPKDIAGSTSPAWLDMFAGHPATIRVDDNPLPNSWLYV